MIETVAAFRHLIETAVILGYHQRIRLVQDQVGQFPAALRYERKKMLAGMDLQVGIKIRVGTDAAVEERTHGSPDAAGIEIVDAAADQDDVLEVEGYGRP